jgi:spore germination cell wall hydrolase CwlJ-like protein
MAVDSGSYTPDVIARRKALADALYNKKRQPMTHWMQGVEMLGDNLVGGLLEGKNKRDRQEAGEMQAKMLEQLSPQAAPPAAPASPRPVSMAPTNDKVYANDEPSPLDPPSGNSRDMLARALLAEAGNQGPVGMQAVANVVRNRAASGNFGGDTVEGVLQKPYQFEPFNTAIGRGKMAAMDPNSPRFQEALGAIDRAYAGNDPTMGATHFYAPKAQAALGRPAPKWDNGTGVNIGDHRFFGGAGTPQVTAGASPTDVSAQSRAPQAAPQQPDQRALIADMLRSKNPYIQQQGQTLAAALLQKQFASPSFDFKVAGDALYRVDPRTGKVERAGEASKVQFTKIGTNPQTGEDIMGFVDPGTGKVTPYQVPQQAQAAPQPMPGAVPAVPPQIQIPPAPPGTNPKVWRDTFTKDAAEKAVVQPQREKEEKKVANIVIEDVDRAIKEIDNAILPTTGAVGGILSNVGGTAARNVRALVDTVKANAGFAELQKMRNNSPTGGALGNVSEREIAYLQATIGNLEQSQDDKQLKDNLRRVKNAYLDIIHGEGKGPQREKLSFKDGPADIQAGHVEDGYRFKGGNKADPKNWEKI